MTDAVADWLAKLGLGQYAEVFAAHDVDLRALPHLSNDDLKELGVSLGHRKIILAAIAALAAPPAAAEPAAEAEPVAAPSPAAERRQLTVVFCDLVGSTALSRRLDPEDLRDLMRRYQDTVAGAVTRYGGHVAQYLGDGVLAYFGWPVAFEDQAERAIRAAIDAEQAVRGLAGGTGEQLAVRVGIATGEVVIGESRGELHHETDLATGDTPNLAARLQTLAAPGEILIGEGTRVLIGRTFELEDRGRHEAKGFETPVAVWRVLRERAAESRFETAQHGRMTPLVGRQHELALLLDRWREAKAGEGQVVLLSGEPGIGKSRLLQALQEGVAEDDHFRIRYQCSPYHTNSALYPVITFFERGATIRPEDDAETRLDKLEALIRRGGEPDRQSLALFAAMLSLPYEARYGRLEMTPEQRRERTLTELIDEMLRLAARKPVLFLLEDAHWIDPSTQELFAQSFARIEAAQVLMVITYRPEKPPELPAASHITMLQLNRLPRGQVEELIQAVAGSGAASDLIAEVAARTDGVPLFVEEMTRALVEGGIESGRVGAIPSTLQGSLLARLDRLDPDAREVAQIGAVVGREFDRRLLAMVLDRPADALDASFEALLGSQLLVSGPNRDTLVFRHALIQDAAYRSLLSSRRRDYHNRIAELLADHMPDVAQNQPELIAHHYAEAGQNERAIGFWRRAGEQAAERFALQEAVQYLQRGLQLADAITDPRERRQAAVPIRIALGAANDKLGQYEQSLRQFAVAFDDAAALDAAVEMARAAIGYARDTYWQGEIDPRAPEMLTRALRAIDDEHRTERCVLLHRLGADALLRGNSAEAEAIVVEAVALAEELGDKRALFETYALDGGLTGVNQVLRPAAVDERRELIAKARRLAIDVNDPDYLLRTYVWASYVLLEAGDREAFATNLAEYQEAVGKYQLRHHVYFFASARVIDLVLDGALDDAARAAEDALQIGQDFTLPQSQGIYGIQMFTIQRERGRLAEVAPTVKLIVDQQPADSVWRPGFALIARDLGMTDVARKVFDELAETDFDMPTDAKTSTVLAYLAEVCVDLRDRKRAEQLYRRLDVYREMTVTLGICTMCYGAAGRYLGLLADCMDDWPRAEEDFEAALALNRRLQAGLWLAHTQHDYARMLRRRGRLGDQANAEVLLSEAWQTAERLDMVALQQDITRQRH